MYENSIKLLSEELAKINIFLTDDMKTKFLKYLDMIIEWNKKMNLTAIVDPNEIAIKHFFDSCTIINAVDICEKSNVIDVGTGAGFPGIPLKIVEDRINLTLLDSLNKRLVFIEEVKKNINIQANLIHARAEVLSKEEKYRETFDISVSRAVSALNILSEYCLPYVKIGGFFLAMKGPNAEKEIEESYNSIETLGGKIEAVKDYNLLGGAKRKIIIIKKIKSVPQKYPRSTSKILKKPL